MCFAGKDRDVAALTRGDYSGDTLRQRPLSAVPIHARQQTMAKSAASPIPCLLALAVFLAFFPVLGTQADAETSGGLTAEGREVRSLLRNLRFGRFSVAISPHNFILGAKGSFVFAGRDVYTGGIEVGGLP